MHAWKFFVICFFFKLKFFEILFQEYHQSVKEFEPRSGLMFCHVMNCFFFLYYQSILTHLAYIAMLKKHVISNNNVAVLKVQGKHMLADVNCRCKMMSVIVCLFVWCLTTHQPLWVISIRRY